MRHPRAPHARGAILGLAALGLVAAALACSADPEPAAGAATAGEIAQRIASGRAPVLLDVRRPDEFETGHVPGALNIPHTELAGRLDEIPAARDQELVLYCERGGRAGIATQTLEEAGFTAVREIEGHMSGWREAGLPVE